MNNGHPGIVILVDCPNCGQQKTRWHISFHEPFCPNCQSWLSPNDVLYSEFDEEELFTFPDDQDDDWQTN